MNVAFKALVKDLLSFAKGFKSITNPCLNVFTAYLLICCYWLNLAYLKGGLLF
jgi:hypothetical protein